MARRGRGTGLSKQRHPGLAQAILKPFGGVEQQGDPVILGDVARVFGQPRDQQQGCGVVIACDQHE